MAVQLEFADVEGRDATVLAGRDLVLTAQVQDFLCDVRQALGLSGIGGIESRGRVIPRQQAGLLPEKLPRVIGVLGRHGNRQTAGGVVARAECVG